jgi:hypothetical protein
MRTRDHRTSSRARAGAALTALAAIAVVAGCTRPVSAPGAGATGRSPLIGDGTRAPPARPRADRSNRASSGPAADDPRRPGARWTVDLAGQLQCDSPIRGSAAKCPVTGDRGPRTHRAEALDVFLGPSNPYASLPTTGFVRAIPIRTG